MRPTAPNQTIGLNWLQNRIMVAASFRNIKHLQTFIATEPNTKYDILYLPPVPFSVTYVTHALLCFYIALSLKNASSLCLPADVFCHYYSLKQQTCTDVLQLYYIMLCYVMLCYVMLCYVMLCYVVLCCVVLCCVVLCCVVLCYIILYYIIL